MLFKFVLKNPFDIDEVHVWDWKFSLNTLTLDAIKAVICDLFAVPIGSVQRITWFDGEDHITISSTGQLTHILNYVSSRTAPFSGPLSVRCEVKLQPDVAPSRSTIYQHFSQHEHATLTCKPPVEEKCTQKMLHRSCSFSPYLNQNIVCDGCTEDLYGIRYKCLICDDYDLCSTCFVDCHHSDHAFIAIRPPPAPNEVSFGVIKTLSMVKTAMAGSLSKEPEMVSMSVPHEESQVESLSDSTPEWVVVSDSDDSVSLVAQSVEKEKISKGSVIVQENSETIELESPQFGEIDEANALLLDMHTGFGQANLVENCPSSVDASHVIIEPVSTANPTTTYQPLSSNVQLPTSLLSSPSLKDNPTTEKSEVNNAAIANSSSEFADRRVRSTTDKFQAALATPAQPPQHYEAQDTLRDTVLNLFRQFGFMPVHRDAVDNLQVLLGMGYTDDGGILTMLLAENNNNVDAVIKILKSQHYSR